MATSPLTASRYPQSTASPNVSQDIQNAVTDLEDNTIPYFATSGARDTAFTNWVAAGNSMRDGLYCHVQGTGLMQYVGTTWVSITKTLDRRIGATASGTLASGASVDICTAQSIPAAPFGPGVSYVIDADATYHTAALPAGTGVKLEILFDGVVQDGDVFVNPTSTIQYTNHARSMLTVADNSAHTVRAVLTNQGTGTLTGDVTYGRLILAIRPYVVF